MFSKIWRLSACQHFLVCRYYWDEKFKVDFLINTWIRYEFACREQWKTPQKLCVCVSPSIWRDLPFIIILITWNWYDPFAFISISGSPFRIIRPRIWYTVVITGFPGKTKTLYYISSPWHIPISEALCYDLVLVVLNCSPIAVMLTTA